MTVFSEALRNRFFPDPPFSEKPSLPCRLSRGFLSPICSRSLNRPSKNLSRSVLPEKNFRHASSRENFLSPFFPERFPVPPCRLSGNDGCEYSLNKRKKPKRSAPALPEKIFCSAPPGIGEAVPFPGQKRPKSRRSARPSLRGAFECRCSAKRDLSPGPFPPKPAPSP